MNIHKNARLTPLGRERVVRQVVMSGQTPEAAARAAGATGPARYFPRFAVGDGPVGERQGFNHPVPARYSLTTIFDEFARAL